MRIDGKAIAEEIFQNLKHRVSLVITKGVTPKLVIILIGDDQASASYVRQKELKAKLVGIETVTEHLPVDISQVGLLEIIKQYNNDQTVHGIIVQRPLPKHIDDKAIDEAVEEAKDVDAFHPQTKFTMPIAEAVLEVLHHIYLQTTEKAGDASRGAPFGDPALVSAVGNVRGWRAAGPAFDNWLKTKNIVVVGKGATGGKPIIEVLKQREAWVFVVDSKTENPREITSKADILVAAVGKTNIIKPDMLKQGVILIGIGMHRGEDDKLYADYNEEEIDSLASFYTPVPGGIGPVNVAMLLANVVLAAENIDR